VIEGETGRHDTQRPRATTTTIPDLADADECECEWEWDRECTTALSPATVRRA